MNIANMYRDSVPGMILAGGRSSRMGGGDKGLLTLAGMTLLERIKARIEPQCSVVSINANGSAARFSSLGLPVFADKFTGYAGPLAGILMALDWAAGLGAQYVVTVPGDTPFLPEDLVSRLMGESNGEGPVLAASVNQSGLPGVHPVIGVWPVGLSSRLFEALAGGVRRVTDFTDQFPENSVIWQDTGMDPFFNINTVDELRFAEAFLTGAHRV